MLVSANISANMNLIKKISFLKIDQSAQRPTSCNSSRNKSLLGGPCETAAANLSLSAQQPG